jgi:hypothetical protein
VQPLQSIEQVIGPLAWIGRTPHGAKQNKWPVLWQLQQGAGLALI